MWCPVTFGDLWMALHEVPVPVPVQSDGGGRDLTAALPLSIV